MMKILDTHFNGKLQTLAKQEDELYDVVRLLSQALVGEGTVYVDAYGECEGLHPMLSEGPDQMKRVTKIKDRKTLHAVDRVLIITPDTERSDLLASLARYDAWHTPYAIVTLSDVAETLERSIAPLALKFNKGLLPAEDGSRHGLPSLALCAFLLTHILTQLQEMTEEWD
jgi:hypothetical protein